jgi:DNA-binding beta-propeller fold protein YncE
MKNQSFKAKACLLIFGLALNSFTQVPIKAEATPDRPDLKRKAFDIVNKLSQTSESQLKEANETEQKAKLPTPAKQESATPVIQNVPDKVTSSPQLPVAEAAASSEKQTSNELEPKDKTESGFASASASSGTAHLGKEIYYISSTGYLIKLDLDTIAETGQLPAGTMPWGAASCGGHIYLTDFGSDELIDFSPSDKNINRVKILDSDLAASEEIALYEALNPEAKKSGIQKVFEKIHKPKKEAAKPTINSEPLLITTHNKKQGLGSVTCNKDYVFVVVTLKNKVAVLSRKNDTLQKVAYFTLGERPSHVAISPDDKTLAVTSTGLNKIYFANIAGGNLSKQSEMDLEEGPTEVKWLDNQHLFVNNRGTGGVSIINSASQSVVKAFNFENAQVNSIGVSKDATQLYALDGTSKKLYVINPRNFNYEVKPINDSLKFPGIINALDEQNVLIGSEPDGRFLVLKTQDFSEVKKIQTNLPPKAVVQFIETREATVVTKDLIPRINNVTKANSKDDSKGGLKKAAFGFLKKKK